MSGVEAERRAAAPPPNRSGGQRHLHADAQDVMVQAFSDRLAAIAKELARAEKLSGNRRDALTQLAAQLNHDAQVAVDKAKVRLLGEVVTALADAQS